MREQDYTYAVARIRSRENKLLTNSYLEQLLNQKSFESLMQTLQEKGFGTENPKQSADELLSAETDKLWSLMKELVKEENAFDFFLVQNDYHNLKVSVKSLLQKEKPEELFIKTATVDPDLIYEAIEKREYSKLPIFMQSTAKDAVDTLLKTLNGQLCDVIIDVACLNRVYALGQENPNEAVREYTEVLTASTDIKVAVRCANTKKALSFIKRSLVPCESLNTEKLANAAQRGFEEICGYLLGTVYKDSVEPLKESMSAFEKWCDDLLTQKLKPQKWEPFTIGPLVAYVLARQNEIKALRLILSAKQNDLDNDIIRERLREMYV